MTGAVCRFKVTAEQSPGSESLRMTEAVGRVFYHALGSFDASVDDRLRPRVTRLTGNRQRVGHGLRCRFFDVKKYFVDNALHAAQGVVVFADGQLGKGEVARAVIDFYADAVDLLFEAARDRAGPDDMDTGATRRELRVAC